MRDRPLQSEQPNPAQHRLNRWRDVVGYAIVGAPIAAAIAPWISRRIGITSQDAPATALNSLDSTVLSADTILLILVSLMSGLWLLYGKGRTLGWLGIKHLHTHPPTWVSVVIGLGFISLASPYVGTSQAVAMIEALTLLLRDSSWVGWTGTFFIVVVMAAPSIHALLNSLSIYRYFTNRLRHIYLFRAHHGRKIYDRTKLLRENTASRSEPIPAATPGTSFKDILDGIETDDEVIDARNDWFKHHLIAERIVDHLADESREATVALIGPKGSGKSSIRNMVIESLRTQSSVKIVPVSLWPFDSAEAAVRGILQAVIKEIGKHTSILSLTGVSDDYATAIERTAGFPGVGRLLRGNSAPDELVAKISAACCAVGIRVVVWIEDVERFTGSAESTNPEQREKDYEKLSPVRALLHLFDRHKGISVVVADASLRSGVDVHKLARFVETIPALTPTDIWTRLSVFRAHCFTTADDRFIDPASPDHRSLLTWHPSDAMNRRIIGTSIDADTPVTICIADLISTPRELKSIMRHARLIWRELEGEIDFDSLLAYTVIRVAHPGVFSALDAHIDKFRAERSGAVQPEADGEEGSASKVNKWHELLNFRTLTNNQKPAMDALLNYLFPPYNKDSNKRTVATSTNPQGLWRTDSDDVWRDLGSLAKKPQGRRDQDALKSIRDWQQGANSDLIQRICSHTSATQIVQFKRMFAPTDSSKLLADTCSHLLIATSFDRDFGTLPLGVLMLEIVVEHTGFESLTLEADLTSIVERAVPRSLVLAVALTRSFAGSLRTPGRFMDDEGNAKIRKKLFSRVATLASQSPDNYLASVISTGDTPYLLWIMYSLESVTSPSSLPDVPPEGWREIRAALLNYLRTSPSQAIPIISTFITKARRRSQSDIRHSIRLRGPESKEPLFDESTEWKVDEELLHTWFEPSFLLSALKPYQDSSLEFAAEFVDRGQALLAWARSENTKNRSHSPLATSSDENDPSQQATS